MPTIITGTRDVASANATNIKVRDVEKKISLLKPYQTPLEDFFVSKYLREEETRGALSKFEWYEDVFMPDVTTLNGQMTGGSATATMVTNEDYFQVDDVILNELYDEMYIVTVVNSASNYTVKRIGGGNVTTTATATRMQRLVPSVSEDGGKVGSKTTVSVNMYAYCQIIKALVSQTGRDQASDSYGDSWDYQWVKKGLELREAIERMYLLSTNTYYDSATKKTYAVGLLGALTTNRFGYTTAIDEDTLDSGLKTLFDAGGSGRRIIMGGSTFVNDLNAFMKDRYSIIQDTGKMNIQQYGIASTMTQRPRIITYLHTQGIVDVVWNPQLKGKYTYWAVAFDPENVIRRYMGSDKKGTRKYRTEKGIQTVGSDTYDAMYMSDIGLQVKYETTGGWFYKS